MDPLAWIDDELASLERQRLRRFRRLRIGPQTACTSIDGLRLVNFGSNDYLGLAADPRLAEAAADAVAKEGWGSGASPLVTGHTNAHQRLAQRLAEFEDVEAALVFTSGFSANTGTIAALVGPGDAVYCDRKNHASLFDGCRLSRADVRVYPHTDCERLASLLSDGVEYRRRLIVTDGLFSMDGDLAPLPELVELAERHSAMLLVDEAHATGVFGDQGRGVCEHFGVEDGVHIRIGTLSKAIGSIGGFVAGRQSLIEWLVNRARPYVFSTASPPSTAAAAQKAVDIVCDEPHRRRQLLENADRLREQLKRQGWNVGPSASQIIPLVVGEEERALQMSAKLRDRGLFVPAIRPPTVPEGEACLRVSLTFDHTEEMVGRLLNVLASHSK